MKALVGVVLAAGIATAGGCAVTIPEGVDRLEAVQAFAAAERHEDALEVAEDILEDDENADGDEPRLSRLERADLWFTAAESALALGQHRKAYTYYRLLLENAPWSTYTAVIEDRLFSIGTTFLYDEDYGGFFDDRDRGVEVLETLAVHFHRSDQADDALRHVADHFAREEEWIEASMAYERVWREYPDSEWAERSLWLAAHYRLRPVPGPEYDQQGLLLVHELLTRSRDVHPRGVAADEVASDLARTRELLAAGEVIVADFYAGRGIDAGVSLRLANAALLYPETEGGRTAARRLAELGVTPSADAPATSSIDKSRRVPPPWEGR